MIKRLRLDSLLSFPPSSEWFDLRPLNVLIGSNGSGKSNLIEAMKLLSATPLDLAMAVRKGGGSDEWVWKGAPEANSAEIDVVLDGRTTPTRRDMRYRLSFAPVERRLELLDEAIEETTPGPGKDDVYFYYRFQRGHPVINVRTVTGETAQRRLRREDLLPDQSVLAQRKDPEQFPEVTWVGRSFAAIQTLTDWTLGRHTPARDPQPADLPEDQLLRDGSNLALVLNNIVHTADTQINDLLRQFYPRFGHLSTRISGGMVQFQLHEPGFKTPIPATRLSDGTFRFITLLAVLLSPSPPPLLCIEAPELGLHPDAVALLAEVLVEASTRMQIVVATHSDALVSVLTEQPDAIVACERPGAATILRRLDSEKLASWLEDYRLGDLWRMGELGANP